MTDLLGEEDAPRAKQRARRRRQDPKPDGGAYAVSRLKPLQYEVYRLVSLYGPATDTELLRRAWDADVAMSDDLILARRAELVALGFLRAGGTRPIADNGVETIWEVEGDMRIPTERIAQEDARSAVEGGSLIRESAVPPMERRATAPSGWWDRELVVLDCETTAADPDVARIVQLALIVHEEGGPFERPERDVVCLVHQDAEIPAEAAAVHGITRERCNAEGRELADVLGETIGALEVWAERGHPLVIFNANYDRRLLFAECARIGLAIPAVVEQMPVVDPLTLHRGLEPTYYGRRRLVDLLERYGVSKEALRAHDATDDARATARLLAAMRVRHPHVIQTSLEALQTYQREAYAAWRAGSLAYWKTKGQVRDIKPVTWLG